eukprot:6466516-Amphidinium_carterae.1
MMHEHLQNEEGHYPQVRCFDLNPVSISLAMASCSAIDSCVAQQRVLTLVPLVVSLVSLAVILHC